MRCGHCGGSNEANVRFCASCGAAVAAGMPPPTAQPAAGTEPQTGSGFAVASLVLGIMSLAAACLPICGLPTSIGAIALSGPGARSDSRGLAIAGRVMGIIGLVLSLINFGWGAYLGATGQHPLLQGTALQP